MWQGFTQRVNWHPAAQYYFVQMNRFGLFQTPKDSAHAFELLKKSAEQGYVPAQKILANPEKYFTPFELLEWCEHTGQDSKQAFKLAKADAIANNDADTLFELGERKKKKFEEAWVERFNEEFIFEAMSCYQAAANLGHDAAKANYKRWIRRAEGHRFVEDCAKKGDERSAEYLSRILKRRDSKIGYFYRWEHENHESAFVRQSWRYYGDLATAVKTKRSQNNTSL